MADDAPQTPHTPPPAADPQSIEGLFLQALGQSPEQREAFLDEACGEDAERRRRIEALLRAYEDAGSFLEKPPAGVDSAATVSLEFLTPSDDPGLLGMLGAYEVYEMLGRGGMGIVFRARDPKLNRVVAIKVLAPELAANPNARRRFLREAQAAAAISHPHVVTIHAVDEGASAQASPGRQSGDGGGSPAAPAPSTLPYLVMECIVGQTLQQKLDKQGSLRLMEILRIGHQTAQGLAAAHKQGLIHRDIKPANILLENGVERVKITDFGLARAADDVSITRTGEVSGTPQYMSPEQASGGTIDHRSDLFSLGCVLYAMCTGRSPFRATTLAAAIRRVCDDTPRPIEEINPEAPPWLIAIVNRLLAKDPDERIQSADEVAELLGDHLAGVQHPFGRRADTSPGRLDSPVSRRRDAASRAAIESSAAAVPLTMPSVKARVAVWAGALLLLVPLFVWLIAMALDNHPQQRHNAGEMAFVLSLFCLPAGLLAVGFGSIYLLNRRSPLGNALFLAICVLMGPIGILLYLVRHHHLQEVGDGREAQPPRRVGGGREPAAQKPSEVPQWLLTPLPGPAKVLALLLGGIAALVLGQAIEQWSDVDAAAGTFLCINAAVLALLAWWVAVAAGVRFDGWTWLLVAIAAVPLMFLGAQAPDREFRQGLARFVQNSDAIAWITSGVTVLAVWIAYCVHAATRDPESDRTPGERLGRGLVIGGVGLWALLAAWMAGVAAEIVSPPPFAHRDLVGGVVMGAVVVGGVLFVLGMILSRWVITPGMVRQLSDATQPPSSDTGAAPAPAPSSSGGASPWRVLGWMIVAGLVVVPGCMVVMLGLPYLAQSRSNIGVVQIEFASARPVVNVVARGDIGAAQSEQRITEHVVTSNPFRLPLPEGVYDLTMTWQADATLATDPHGVVVPRRLPVTGTFVQRVEVEAGRTKTLDVRQKIAVALPLQDADEGQLDKDGYPPPRTIPLSEQGAAASGGDTGGVSEMAALEIKFQDPGLRLHLERREENAPKTVGPFGEEMTITVQPGSYTVTVEDDLAGWRTLTKYGEPDAVRYEFGEITFVPGDAQKLTVDRNYYKMGAAFKYGAQQFYFLWNRQTYELDHNQALAVARLLHALADGSVDVHEGRLLRQPGVGDKPNVMPPMSDDTAEGYRIQDAENGNTLKNWFQSGQHPAWGTLIVAGEAKNTYRLAELDQGRDIAEPSSAEAGSPAVQSPPPAVVGSFAPGPGERAGQLTIDIQDDGFVVAVRRKSVFDDAVVGSEQAFTDVGATHLRVAPGKYEVLIRDQLFGWKEDRTSSRTIDADESRTFTIKRDLAKYAEGPSKKWTFLWDGREYRLPSGGTWPGSHAEGMAIQKLLAAYAAGSPDVPADELLTAWKKTEPNLYQRYRGEAEAQTLEDLLQIEDAEDRQSHPWGRLIVPGETEGTNRLAPLDRGTIEVTDFAPGMVVTVARVETDRRFSQRQLFEGSELEVPSGEYRYTIADDFVGWGQWLPRSDTTGFGSNSNPVRTGTVHVTTGESTMIEADRRWSDYLNPPQPAATSQWIAFMWFPKYEPHHLRPHAWGVQPSTGTPDNGIDNFDVPQFRVLRELLRAFADRQPEVAEDELLRRAGVEVEAWEDVFPADPRGYGGRWKTIIVSGAADGTWRLKPPREKHDE